MLPLFLLLLGGSLFFAYLWINPPYETVNPRIGPIKQVVYATGFVEPVAWARISPLLAGRVEKLFSDENEPVEENQILAQLGDDVEQEKYKELQSKRLYLKNELAREKKLHKRDFTSQESLERKESEFKGAEAQLLSQENLLKRLQVRSPLSGILLRRDVEKGEYVKPGDVLFWVGKPKPLRITADIDEEDIPLIKIKQKVLLKSDAYPNQVFAGTVAEITPKGDPASKSFRVRISLPDETLLHIGMTVEINIIVKESSKALLVPATSVYRENVWIIERGKAVPRKVSLGIASPDFVEILSGVHLQDELVKSPARYPRLLS